MDRGDQQAVGSQRAEHGHITVTCIVLSFYSIQSHSNLHLELDLSELKFCSNLDFFLFLLQKMACFIMKMKAERSISLANTVSLLWNDTSDRNSCCLCVCIEMNSSNACVSLSSGLY